MQQTFLYAHRALERGVEPESEAAWLLTIARNVCLTRAKAHRRLPELSEDPHFFDEVLATEEDERGISDEVRTAFASLPERQRRALFLREWQECSYAEIAEALGTSESAVETLLVRARRTLARELAASRRRARDLAGLLGWLRTAIGSTAGKVAVGAAVVGAGAAGTAATVTQSHHIARPATARHARVVVQPVVRKAAPPARRASPKAHVVVPVRHSRTAKRAVAPPPPATPPAATPVAPAPSSPSAVPASAATPASAPTPARASDPPAATQPAAAPTTTATVSSVVTTATSAATSTATGAVSSTVDTAAQTVSNAVPAAAPVVTTAAQTVNQAAGQTAQTVSDATQSVVTTVSDLLPGR